MTWSVCLVSPLTGDVKDIVAQYSNKGHAVSMVRRLARTAWISGRAKYYAIRGTQ